VSRIRAFRYLFCFVLLFTMLGGLMGVPVLAVQENDDNPVVMPPNQEEPPAEDVIDFRCDYPVLCVEAGEEAEFEVELLWLGEERRRFDLATIPPSGWKAEIYTQYGGYPEKPIEALELEPEKLYGNTVKILVQPIPGNLPEPGDYTIALKVSSEDVTGTYEFVAKVSPRYEFAMITQTLRLDTEAKAGEGKHLSVILMNSGSASIEDLSFTSTKPEGWDVTFYPEKIDSLAPGITQELGVVITPPKETEAGDWPVTLRANSDQVAEEVELRVTVSNTTIWGWIVILIVVMVVAGAGVYFWRLSRR